MRLTLKLLFPPLKRLLIDLNRDLDRLCEYSHDYHRGFREIHVMVVLLEDRRYLKHNGVDLISILRELSKWMTFRRHGGASTIEMQYVRTITKYRDNTLKRKLYEITLAKLLQYHLTKQTILDSYISRAYFGHGVWGLGQHLREFSAKTGVN